MSTLIKIIISSILSISLFSCHINFNTGLSGNGNVVIKERKIDREFDQLQVSGGLNVFLTPTTSEGISVEADENLHDYIITEIEHNILKIYPKKNISFNAIKNVTVSFKNLTKISAASGSSIYGTQTISQPLLELRTSSGSAMDLDLNTSALTCSTASGSTLTLRGNAGKLQAQAASGSTIHAESLKVLLANTKATSGADIMVNVSKELLANAASGGDIRYSGNPHKIDKSAGVSGHISPQ